MTSTVGPILICAPIALYLTSADSSLDKAIFLVLARCLAGCFRFVIRKPFVLPPILYKADWTPSLFPSHAESRGEIPVGIPDFSVGIWGDG